MSGLKKIFCASIILCSQGKNDKCLGPPFLYVTVHDEIKNVLKYSRDGCLLSLGILNGKHYSLDSELRSMAINSYLGSTALFVADASDHRSRVVLYLPCDDNISWCHEKTVVSSDENPGCNHAYGLTFDDKGNLYASFQHTDTILHFEKDSFIPLAINPLYRNNRNSEAYFDGTFLQFGEPCIHDKVHRGVRSILHANRNIWIAHEDYEGVVVVSIDSGQVITIISIDTPIGLYKPENSDQVFVGSKSKRFGGSVHVIDSQTFELVPGKTYRSNHLDHPTGISSYKNTLYVAEQSYNHINMFDIDSTEHLGYAVDILPGKVEQIILADI